MKPQRAARIHRAVEAGLRRWPEAITPVIDAPVIDEAPEAVHDADVVQAMPRRKPTHKVDTAHVHLPMARRVVFRAGIVRPFVRLLVWFWACTRFFSGNIGDRLTGKASVQRRAARLRRVFEQTGASFSKLGQQLALRADLLPYAYCAELSKMLDQAIPFPTSEAIATIERSLGRPLAEMFETFDPVPIGSASLACVFQARLRSGERVAVKVRRPGIGPLLAADLRAMDWLLVLAETFAFIRPGLTAQFRQDLRKMLLGELNFRAEARYTEMFRLRAEQDGDGITAPRVFFEYCTEEVMVNELVSGVWMWELMAAVDSKDQEFLLNARSIGIEPKAVAKRLILVLHRELLEHLFFHADPHPANIVILPDSKICFIDFGAVGRFSTEIRNTWRELQYHMRNQDITRMVHCSLNLSGSLPPIDVDRTIKAIEDIYADWVYAINSTDAEWWERSTAQNWLRFINVAREYGIPVSLETIQFLRATLLYDSIIARLDKDVDPVEEYKHYARIAGKAARSRVREQFKKRLGGPTRMDYLRIEQLTDMVNQFAFKLQKAVEDPIIDFKNVVGKIAYSFSMVLWLAYWVAILAGLSVIASVIAERWFGLQINWASVLETWASFGWLQILIVIVALVILRKVLIRMKEPDRRPDSRR